MMTHGAQPRGEQAGIRRRAIPGLIRFFLDNPDGGRVLTPKGRNHKAGDDERLEGNPLRVLEGGRVRAALLAMFRESAEVTLRFAEAQGERIEAVARHMAEALRRGNKILFCGNGGSAADSQHLAAEFVNRFLVERRALPALALTTDSSALTAIGNDRGFEEIFSRQVAALASPGDVLVGISTSGGSRNVLRALQAARERGCATVAFTGASGGPVAAAADEVFLVPSSETPRIQETHIVLGHALCALVERLLVEGDAAPAAEGVRSGRTER
jgi:D-sedoheptulose 7-phosphate isomerase